MSATDSHRLEATKSLYEAIRLGDTHGFLLAEEAIRGGANLDAVDINGINFLIAACSLKAERIALLLIKQPSINLGFVVAESSNIWLRCKSALDFSIQNNMPAVVAALIEKDPSLILKKNRNGYSPIEQAGIRGNFHIAQLLVSHGAKPDFDTPYFKTLGFGDVIIGATTKFSEDQLTMLRDLASQYERDHAVSGTSGSRALTSTAFSSAATVEKSPGSDWDWEPDPRGWYRLP